MKPTAIKHLVLLILLSLAGLVFAESIKGIQCKTPLRIIYVNGVLNTFHAATDSRIALEALLKEVKFENLDFKLSASSTYLAHNSSFMLLDLFEAFQQWSSQQTDNFLTYLFNLDKAPVKFLDAYLRIAAQTFRLDDTDGTLVNLINEEIIVNGGVSLIVAHSQGNFFANNAIVLTRNSELLHFIDDKLKVRLVSVASPASYVADGGSYTTLSSDGVIKLIPSALAPNVTNTAPAPGKFDHEFIKHYLNGDLSRAQIKAQIYFEVTKLGKIKGREITPVCKRWFENNYAKKTKNTKCLDACLTVMIDMGTDTCALNCAELCACKEIEN